MRVYAWQRAAAERVANSWREWRFGPVRVIVHAAYAGLAAIWTASVMGALLGSGALWSIGIVCSAALLGAALWAQWVEGASVSLRPFGYYGSVVGGACGGLVVLPLLHVDPWPVIGALCAAAPIAQAIGRLRCLVQGCCHGRRTRADLGIVFRHPRSRAVRLAGLGEVPVHPTQLYSILWCVPFGWLLLRLCHLDVAPSAIAGLYLILSGIGRFVEEGYRGEPQTRVIAGLPVYQWLAIASVVGGAVCTTVTSAWPAPVTPAPALSGWIFAFGLLVALAMGVDFPSSDRRFARLVR